MQQPNCMAASQGAASAFSTFQAAASDLWCKHHTSSAGLNRLTLLPAPPMQDARAYKYDNVWRWTLPKRLASKGQASPCLLECDRLIVPVHCGQTHWACAMVDLQNRRLCYFDSLRVRVQCLREASVFQCSQVLLQGPSGREISWERSIVVCPDLLSAPAT